MNWPHFYHAWSQWKILRYDSKIGSWKIKILHGIYIFYFMQGSPKLPLRLSNALVRLRQVADHIFNVSTECKLEMELDSMFTQVDLASCPT